MPYPVRSVVSLPSATSIMDATSLRSNLLWVDTPPPPAVIYYECYSLRGNLLWMYKGSAPWEDFGKILETDLNKFHFKINSLRTKKRGNTRK